MNKTLRYEHDGHNIVVNYNNQQLGTSYIQKDNISLYVDGECCELNESELPPRSHLTFTVGEKPAYISLSPRSQSIFVGDLELDPIQTSQQTKKVNIDHVQILYQYPPLARLNYADFLALKCTDPEAISQSSNQSQFYLRVNKDAKFPGLNDYGILKSDSLRAINSNDDFVRIAWSDIRPGDDIIVAERTRMGQQITTLVENVSHVERFKCEYQFNPDQIGVLEGSNTTWTSFDAKRHFEQVVIPEMEAARINYAQLASIFNDITFDEFQMAQEIFNHNIGFTEQMFQDLANGKSVEEVVEMAYANAFGLDFADNQDPYGIYIQDNLCVSDLDDLDGLDNPHVPEY